MRFSLIIMLLSAVLFPFCITETKVKEVDISGRVVIPVAYTTEVEPNDDITNAQGLGYIDYYYIVVEGSFASVGAETDPFGNVTYTGDLDIFSMSAPFEGDVTFTLEGNSDYTFDYDLYLYGRDGDEYSLLGASNSSDTNVSETISISTEWGKEYILLTAGKETDDPDAEYRITVSGVSPVDTLSLMIGAYLYDDIEDPGAPVGGTTTSTFYHDETGNVLNWYSDFYIFNVWAVTSEPYVYPEWVDFKDNDCNGVADDGKDTSDMDGDGHSIEDGDCNDTDSDIYPSSKEVYDGKDNDCNGIADDVIDDEDRDGDGYPVYLGDCNDQDATVYPDAEEVEDGIDNDCDGEADDGEDETDADGDGFTIKKGDCNDTDAGINPDAEEAPDGIDNDCNGTADDIINKDDADGDNISVYDGDCNDTDPNIYPGIAENTIDYKVDDQLEKVYLFAGEFTNLNDGPIPGGLRSFESTEVDLSKTRDGDVVQGITVTVNYRYPPFGKLFREEEPNDTEVSGWAPGDLSSAQQLGAISYEKVDKLRGNLSSIVASTWNGDNDLYAFEVPEDGYVDILLDWENSGWDYDFVLVDEEGDINYEGATTSYPESTTQEVTQGETLYLWIIGYSGDASDYMVTIYHY